MNETFIKEIASYIPAFCLASTILLTFISNCYYIFTMKIDGSLRLTFIMAFWLFPTSFGITCLAMFKDDLENMPYESTAILTIFLVLIFCFVSYAHGKSLEDERRKNTKILNDKDISTDNEYQKLEEEYKMLKMFNQIEFESLINSGNFSKEKMFEIISDMYSEEKELKEELENLKNKNL